MEIHLSSESSPHIEGRLWDEADVPAHRLVVDAVLASDSHAPIQARRMSQRDIDDLRRWHRGAVERSLDAGRDIVYVYAGHSLSTLHHFLSPASTSARTPTAVRSRTGHDCSARCWRRRARPARVWPPSPAASR